MGSTDSNNNELRMLPRMDTAEGMESADENNGRLSRMDTAEGMESADENNGRLSMDTYILCGNQTKGCSSGLQWKKLNSQSLICQKHMLILSMGVKETSDNMFDIKKEVALMKLSVDESDSDDDLYERDVLDDTFENSTPNINPRHYFSPDELTTPLPIPKRRRLSYKVL
ncbi:hypothetical protein F8M41_018976 [Gigaspora margarita]|uniref:Uncharacterized protein n=1 Tax=Gigaspora margarita TaxID=4874 RepID=A0A8H4EKS7_GIGMA|nr:hypothetical protein F8M41_018976 [Gigaspora margarita]